MVTFMLNATILDQMHPGDLSLWYRCTVNRIFLAIFSFFLLCVLCGRARVFRL